MIMTIALCSDNMLRRGAVLGERDVSKSLHAPTDTTSCRGSRGFGVVRGERNGLDFKSAFGMSGHDWAFLGEGGCGG